MLKRLPRRLTILLLPLLLLATQQGALAHLVSHLGEEQPQHEETLVHEKLCGACLSAESLFSFVGAEPTPYLLQSASFQLVAATGIDREIRRKLRGKELPVTFHFRVFRNGAVAHEETVVYADHKEGSARAWRRFRIPVEPGDTLRDVYGGYSFQLDTSQDPTSFAFN